MRASWTVITDWAERMPEAINVDELIESNIRDARQRDLWALERVTRSHVTAAVQALRSYGYGSEAQSIVEQAIYGVQPEEMRSDHPIIGEATS